MYIRKAVRIKPNLLSMIKVQPLSRSKRCRCFETILMMLKGREGRILSFSIIIIIMTRLSYEIWYVPFQCNYFLVCIRAYVKYIENALLFEFWIKSTEPKRKHINSIHIKNFEAIYCANQNIKQQWALYSIFFFTQFYESDIVNSRETPLVFPVFRQWIQMTF